MIIHKMKVVNLTDAEPIYIGTESGSNILMVNVSFSFYRWNAYQASDFGETDSYNW